MIRVVVSVGHVLLSISLVEISIVKAIASAPKIVALLPWWFLVKSVVVIETRTVAIGSVIKPPIIVVIRLVSIIIHVPVLP